MVGSRTLHGCRPPWWLSVSQTGSSLQVFFTVSTIFELMHGFGVGLMDHLQRPAGECFCAGCDMCNVSSQCGFSQWCFRTVCPAACA